MRVWVVSPAAEAVGPMRGELGAQQEALEMGARRVWRAPRARAGRAAPRAQAARQVPEERVQQLARPESAAPLA